LNLILGVLSGFLVRFVGDLFRGRGLVGLVVGSLIIGTGIDGFVG
jgi:hypothetical protein